MKKSNLLTILLFIFIAIYSNNVEANKITYSEWFAQDLLIIEKYNIKLWQEQKAENLREYITNKEFFELLKMFIKDVSNEKESKVYNILDNYNVLYNEGESLITRQEIVSFIYNLIKYDKIVASNEKYNVQYIDTANIKDWALDGISYLTKKGIVKGTGNNMVNPDSYATKEEALALIARTFDVFYAGKFNNVNNYLELTDKIQIGLGYSSSSINVSKFRRSAVLTTPYGIIVGYYNELGEVTIVLINDNLDVKKLNVYPNIPERLLGDGHCSINLGYIGNMVYLMYGAHATTPFYAAFDISSFDYKLKVQAEILETLLTYPQFYNIKDELYLVFRRDTDPFLKKHSDRDKGIYIINMNNKDKTINFEKAMKIFSSGDDNSVYIHDIGVYENMICIPFVFRLANDGTNGVRNDGVYLIYSEDCGETYKSHDGHVLKLPVQKNQVEKLINIKKEDNLMNQDSCYISDKGIIYITHLNNDENGIPQVHLSVVNLNQGSVRTTVVSNNCVDFDLIGKGTLVLPLSRSDVVASENYVHVVYRQGNKMMIASCELDKDGYPNGEWSYLSPYSEDLGAWEPNYDKVLWETSRILSVLVQSAVQGEADTNLRNEPTPIYLFLFREK